MASTSIKHSRLELASSRTIAMAGIALLASVSLVGCSPTSKPVAMPVVDEPAAVVATPPAATEAPAAEPPAAPAPVKGLTIVDTKVGTGATAKTGDSVTMNYSGYLTDGTKFDSSLDSGQPFVFVLGRGDVIAGWDQGIVGMKVGGKRKLTIAPELGYGAQGAGGVIPPNATLVFDVELMGIN